MTCQLTQEFFTIQSFLQAEAVELFFCGVECSPVLSYYYISYTMHVFSSI